MIPDYCLRVESYEIASGAAIGWTETMIAEAKVRACQSIAKKGKKVLTCDFVENGGGWVRACSSDTFGRNTFNHPSAIATVFRDGSMIAK